MSPEVQNELDACFSPLDELSAIEQIYEQLPELHKPRRFPWPSLYYGWYHWAGVGFTYKQAGNELVVIDVWWYREAAALRKAFVSVVFDLPEMSGRGA
jgi:hypothetical protein